MTYEEARIYIQDISRMGSIPGLESIKNLMNELNNVQERLSIIHIAGTNGKGSVGAFLESVLIEAGKTVGRYTSPAVFSLLEVWRINRKDISKADYAKYVAKVKKACDTMTARGMAHPTVFEAETAMAFLYFSEKNCDYVLLETGMGGAMDATNLISRPVCAVITSISMDHMQFLGGTLREIASAKAGIIKEGCPVVTVRQKEEAMQVILEEAQKKKAKLIVSDIWENNAWQDSFNTNAAGGIRYFYKGIGWIKLQMAGEYQWENSHLAAVVLKEVLGISRDAILAGMEKAVWPGRFETILKEPLFLMDGAHNEDAAEKLGISLHKYFADRKIIFIIGVLADKEHEKMLQHLLPMAWRVYTVTPPSPRALAAAELAKEVLKYHTEVRACESIGQAVEFALRGAAKEDVIVACGSLSYLGEIKSFAENFFMLYCSRQDKNVTECRKDW